MTNPHEDSAALHAILEAAVDAIIVSDGQGVILRANPAAAKMFHYDVAEMIGQSVNMLMALWRTMSRRAKSGSSGSGAMLKASAKTAPFFHCIFRWVTQRWLARVSSSAFCTI
jgi:PAS domain-containing protein